MTRRLASATCPILWLALSLLTVAGLASCGGSSTSASTTASTAATPSTGSATADIDPAFIAQVDAICARANSSTDTHRQFPYPSFDPEHPEPSQLPKVGAYFAEVQAVIDHVPVQLAQLGEPTTGAAQWNEILALAREDRAVADRQIEAAKASDVHGFVATVSEIERVDPRLKDAARRAGFQTSSPCSSTF